MWPLEKSLLSKGLARCFCWAVPLQTAGFVQYQETPNLR